MVAVVPETLRRNARPPISMDAAPASGTTAATTHTDPTGARQAHGRNARPPISMDAAPASGTTAATTHPPKATRPTAVPRRFVAPLLFERDADGHRMDDPAVRRFWTAAIGPGAVADLLRLTAAAHAGRRIKEPLRLSILTAEGLVHRRGEIVLVRPLIPRLGPRQLGRLRPGLRAEYRSLVPEAA